MLCVLGKYLLFLGGAFAAWSCTPQANFADLDKEDLFNSTEIKQYELHFQSMPLMCQENQSPGGAFVDGRILVCHSIFGSFYSVVYVTVVTCVYRLITFSNNKVDGHPE